MTSLNNGFQVAFARCLLGLLLVLSATLVRAEVLYVHTDHLGTPRLVTDEQNTVVWRNLPTTEPFGNGTVEEDPDGDSTPTTLNPRFPGQYYDKEVNTHYNYFRDYDPNTGRYVQSDPIGLQGGINPYSYVGGNPLTRTDPEGLQAQALGCAAGAWAGPIGCGVGAGLVTVIGGALLMNTVGADTPKTKEKEQCKDDDDPCDIILDKGQLRVAGIRGREHEVKADELGTNKNLSKFDLCGCKDGRVVIKAHGCKGPVISVTNYRWK